MKVKRNGNTVESVFPNKKGRDAGDKVVDALPMTTTLTEACDAWEEAYFQVAGKSPFRVPG